MGARGRKLSRNEECCSVFRGIEWFHSRTYCTYNGSSAIKGLLLNIRTYTKKSENIFSTLHCHKKLISTVSTSQAQAFLSLSLSHVIAVGLKEKKIGRKEKKSCRNWTLDSASSSASLLFTTPAAAAPSLLRSFEIIR